MGCVGCQHYTPHLLHSRYTADTAAQHATTSPVLQGAVHAVSRILSQNAVERCSYHAAKADWISSSTNEAILLGEGTSRANPQPGSQPEYQNCKLHPGSNNMHSHRAPTKYELSLAFTQCSCRRMAPVCRPDKVAQLCNSACNASPGSTSTALEPLNTKTFHTVPRKNTRSHSIQCCHDHSSHTLH